MSADVVAIFRSDEILPEIEKAERRLREWDEALDPLAREHATRRHNALQASGRINDEVYRLLPADLSRMPLVGENLTVLDVELEEQAANWRLVKDLRKAATKVADIGVSPDAQRALDLIDCGFLMNPAHAAKLREMAEREWTWWEDQIKRQELHLEDLRAIKARRESWSGLRRAIRRLFAAGPG